MAHGKDEIILRGLKENNLKNIDLNIPKEKIIVFTGLSGSGKSSVVFDTLATESRRQMTPSGWQGRWMITGGLFDPDLPIEDYPEEKRKLLLYGPPEGEKVYAPFHTKNGPQPHKWDGLLPRFMRLYIHRDITKLKDVSQEDVLVVSTHSLCQTCQGFGLNPKVLACKINDLHIAEYDQLELSELLEELTKIKDPLGESIALQAIPPVKQMVDMGLGYLSLSRKMDTLSGGEAQRVKIARHLGSSLNNITYIFDEPSAGLHPQEVDLLIQMLNNIKEQHNTVIVIEHDFSVIKAADEMIEMGPGAGVHGGEVIYQGTVANKMIKRVGTLKDVGLGYLTLGQTTSSLSGGEVQRLKLASHLHKEGQIYVLDEPSLGLHTKDNDKLLDVFQTLVNRGNSVIIIEHHLDLIAASDWVIELGPGGGKQGGQIMFEGTPEMMLNAKTLTAKWLKFKKVLHK